MIKHYGWNLFAAFSQLLNALLGCRADIALSAQAQIWKLEGKTKGKVLTTIINFMFKWQKKDHCRGALKGEYKRLGLSIDYVEPYL